MLIREKTTVLIFLKNSSKEAYPIVKQLEKITVKKAQAKIVNGKKKQILGP